MTSPCDAVYKKKNEEYVKPNSSKIHILMFHRLIYQASGQHCIVERELP